MRKSLQTLRRKTAAVAAAAAVLSSIGSVMPVQAVNMEAKDTLPSKLSAPQHLSVYDDAVRIGSNHSRMYVNYAQDASIVDYINHFYGDEWGWGDAEGTEDNYYTGYGVGYREQYIGVQLDYQIDGGEWHYEKSWDTAPYGQYDYDTGFEGESSFYPYFTGSARAFRGDIVASILNEGAEGYIEAGVVDSFQKYTDGSDTYYRFDAENHQLTFRARFYSEVNHWTYYGAPEGTEDETIVILSDWSEPVTYGKGIGDGTSYVAPETLGVPKIAPYIKNEVGYRDAPQLGVVVESDPDVMQYSFSYNSSANVNLQLCMELSTDGKTWVQASSWKQNISTSEVLLDFYDMWANLPGNGVFETYTWVTAPIQLRAKYSLQVIDDTQDITVESDYSEPFIMEIPGADAYTVNISHVGDAWTGLGTWSFQTSEGADLGWITCSFKEGCYVQRVLVNDAVRYDRADEETYALLDWLTVAGAEREEFRFFENENKAYCSLEIVIEYGGEATPVRTLTVAQTPSPGTLTVSDNTIATDYEGTTALITAYDGTDVTLYVTPTSTDRLASITVDGKKIDKKLLPMDDEGRTSYHIGVVSADMSIVITYEQVASSVTVYTHGDGKVLEPTGFDEVAAPGETLTFGFAPFVQEETGAVATVEKIEITEIFSDDETKKVYVAGDALFDAAVAAGALTFTLPVAELCANDYAIVVTFSELEAPQKPEYTISVKIGAGGTGSSTEKVVEGDNCTIYFTADSGYRVDTVLVDGVAVSNLVGDYYYFTDVKADHTIAVTFAPLSVEETCLVNVILQQPENAANVVTPVGEKQVAKNSPWTLSWKLEEGYRLAGLTVNQVALTTEQLAALDGKYTVEKVTEDLTIVVQVEAILCTVRFEDGKGNLLDTVVCAYGTGAKFDYDLTKLTIMQTADSSAIRLFDHWSEDVSTQVYQDTTVVALYAAYEFLSFTPPTKTVSTTSTGALDLTGMSVQVRMTKQTGTDAANDIVQTELHTPESLICSPATLDEAFAGGRKTATISVYCPIIGTTVTYADEAGKDALVGTFELTLSTDAKLGDVNMDGKVDATDATLVLVHYVTGLTGAAGTLTAEQLALAEVDGKEGVSANDATLILQYYVASIAGTPPTWEELRGN